MMLFSTKPAPDPLDSKTWFSDEDLIAAFANTNFGTNDPAEWRQLVEKMCVKKAVHYHCGHTITMIGVQLGLLTPKKQKISKRGINVARCAVHDLVKRGP